MKENKGLTEESTPTEKEETDLPTIIIDDHFCFNSIKKPTIIEVNNALLMYSRNFERALGLKDETPIFLDTNVLLNYYGMSLEEKKKLKDFFEKYLDRIYITCEIENEFLRYRISVIGDFFESLTKVKSNFQKDLIDGVSNSFKSTIDSKILKYDFPELWTEINGIKKIVEEKLFESKLKDRVSESIENVENKYKYLKVVDEIMEIYRKFSKSSPLSDKEIDYIKNQYGRLSEQFKQDQQRKRQSFPGCGEKKPEEKSGDFIIFHEMLKFMKENDTDIIFLTNDVTKEDWIDKDRNPFIHYIEKTYILTNHIMFILHADGVIPGVSFEEIYRQPPTLNIDPNMINEFRERKKKSLSSIVPTLTYEDIDTLLRMHGVDVINYPDRRVLAVLNGITFSYSKPKRKRKTIKDSFRQEVENFLIKSGAKSIN